MFNISLIKFFTASKTGMLCLIFMAMLNQSCSNSNQANNTDNKFQLFVLAPAHFHAALVQKSMYPEIDSTIKVFAPKGQGVENYLNFIKEYNSRTENPTHWNEKVYTGPDYLEKMLQEKAGKNTLVVIAGNNKNKTKEITKSINAGFNVLADKPMAITAEGFKQLQAAFDSAKQKRTLLYDIMTMRYGVVNILQKILLHSPDVFGQLKTGTREKPAVVFNSVHHFYKEVSGRPVTRPVWYFDTGQQGEGIVDVTTHLIDLIQWECFPKTIFDYKKDVRMIKARHWPTVLSLRQFSKVTGVDSFPEFLHDNIRNNQLQVYANGEMNYTLKGVHARVQVVWKFASPEGNGDTYYSSFRGTKAALTIRQDSLQGYKPLLYVEPEKYNPEWKASLDNSLTKIHQAYPGVTFKQTDLGWQVIIPEREIVSPEDQFASVVKKYLHYLREGKMPQWEISAMLTKYYTTTQALKVADKQ